MIPSPSVFSRRRSTARGLRTSRSCRRPVADRLVGRAGLSAVVGHELRLRSYDFRKLLPSVVAIRAWICCRRLRSNVS
jgi:hypothetical protein